MPNPTSYSWTVGDSTSPSVSSVVVLDAFRIRVIYSEPVVSSEALIAGNYGFTAGLVATSVSEESSSSYIVSTSQQTPGQSYTLTVSNVHDLNGNLI